MIENFGSYLKHERELRGVPLEEISSATKIHIRYLQALENNRFDELPGEVFVKGYIRSFAKTIGSDEDEMLNAYDDTMGKLSSTETIEPHAGVQASAKEIRPLIGWGLIILLLVGIGLGGYFFIQQLKASSKKAPSPVSALDTREYAPASASIDGEELTLGEINSGTLKSKIPNPSDEVNDAFDRPSTRRVETEENPPDREGGQDKVLESKAKPDIMADTSIPDEAGESSARVEPADKPLRLSIKVREDVWFNMTVDGSREEDFILPKGTGKTFYGEEFFRMTIGNRYGVELKLNDRALVLPEGDDNNVVRNFIINSQLIE